MNQNINNNDKPHILSDTYRLEPETVFRIAPAYGCNLFSWRIGGEEILYSPKGFPGTPGGFFGGGNPVLFPSVGRTWDRDLASPVAERYWIHGKENSYRMPCHGILQFGSWRKNFEEITAAEVKVGYLFSAPESVLHECYPFDVIFNLNFTLRPHAVSIEACIENKSQEPVPWAFGLHPYFCVSGRNRAAINLPCKKQMILDPELLIPVCEKPIESNTLLLRDERTYDAAFWDMSDGRASIVDSEAGRDIHVDFSEHIETIVIYSAANSDYVCLEPWTKGLGSYECLAENNWQDGNLINVLRPEAKETVAVEYSIEEHVRS